MCFTLVTSVAPTFSSINSFSQYSDAHYELGAILSAGGIAENKAGRHAWSPGWSSQSSEGIQKMNNTICKLYTKY